MPSIKDVAAEAKVSPGTVSKVLNMRSDANISFATSERVRSVARRIGYHPSALARGLAGKPMNTIGVVMAYSQESVTSDPYLGPCLDGILARSKERQQKVTLFLEGDWDAALRSVPIYGEGHCDGLLVIIPRLGSPFLECLQMRRPRLPFVLVGDSREEGGMPCADLDNHAAARMVTSHLIAFGHRRIAAFCGNDDFCSNTQRLEGYKAALTDANLAIDSDLVFEGQYHNEWGARNMARLLDTFPSATRPTAAVGFCDSVAIGALDEMERRGITASDVAVAGIDDIPDAARRGLTTIRHSIRRVGENAVETLLGIIHPERGTPDRVLLAPELIARQSTAVARRPDVAPIKGEHVTYLRRSSAIGNKQ